MSGSSFNYLCFRETLGEVAQGRDDLEDMVKALEELGYDAREVAAASRRLLEMVDQSDEIERLLPVWKAMEWWRSGDWGEAQFWKAVGVWEQEVSDGA